MPEDRAVSSDGKGLIISCAAFHFEVAGDMTSHAAYAACGMGLPCVAGAGSITVDYADGKLTVGSDTVAEGQIRCM